MDMKALFDDFKTHVDSMDDYTVGRSIADAIEHSSNSYLLDDILENGQNARSKSITKSVSTVIGKKCAFSFCSSEVVYSKKSNDWSPTEVNVA